MVSSPQMVPLLLHLFELGVKTAQSPSEMGAAQSSRLAGEWAGSQPDEGVRARRW